MSVVVNRISQLAELFTPEQSENSEEGTQGILEPILRKFEDHDGDLQLCCRFKDTALVVQSSEAIKNTIETAADNFLMYFGEALSEISSLRFDLG